ncbi:glycosyltransferase family 4 protein [Aestuariibaculum sp. YM273]|uniref:glycosyltransferase family 4 protein n=1 Tax=Aestuariibaculum sp. YM273 TaxID=3070659 RepID=UPI0027DCE101|nr:glycosyltransferase family 4 protein [Aestuariibaculum sp. YM273]WMI65831.1 glycosyltransferase family 4 protein [Aestuariibaculum sp. YM273]
MIKILFITHDASRSGAPMVLLHFMRWLKVHQPHIVFDILYIIGGVLESDFEALCTHAYYLPVHVEEKSVKKLVRQRIKKKLGITLDKKTPQMLYEQLALNKYDLIYANTVVAMPYGYAIKRYSPETKCVVHIHELPTIISSRVPNFEHYISGVDKFIAVTPQVNTRLITNFNVPQDRVNVVYECAEVKVNKQPKDTQVFTVGASGISHWRKGNDVFLQIARYIVKHYPDLKIHFVWVGNESSDKPVIDADIEKIGLNNKVKFVGEVEDPSTYFNNFDVFLLTSREDPFPLVCIEVAMLEKPIICFEQASGTAEVVKQGGGFVVPYLDIEAMAEKIVYYYKNRNQMVVDGKNAYDLFKDYSPENICPQLYTVIENTIG